MKWSRRINVVLLWLNVLSFIVNFMYLLYGHFPILNAVGCIFGAVGAYLCFDALRSHKRLKEQYPEYYD